MFDPVFKRAARLISDKRGATLPVIAAAIIPIIAMIGSGLDISRAYLVKSRLSQACDASSLAGRRAMTNNNISSAQTEAMKFFNVNFPQGYLGSAPFTPSITSPDTGVVKITSATRVPTTLMRVLGFQDIPINVECSATQNFENIDILLVLDTTGSMAQSAGGSTKIVALRDAVTALYDELQQAQDQLASQGLRLRYGIVPYSSAVNVGKLLYAENPNYLLTNWTYQSRAPNFDGQGRFSSWTYRPVAYNLSSYIAGGNLTAPVGSNGANVSMSWGGCVEERGTVSSITAGSSTSSIPSGAYDLNIDLIPSSNQTRWKPYLASAYPNYTTAEFNRGSSGNTSTGSSPQMACPAQARHLAVMNRGDMTSYLNSLYPDGGTYHDIGMVWGARFISPAGMFGSRNPTTYNDRPVNRHIIYMTDGILDTGTGLYSGYGLEALDRRVTGGWTSKSDQDSRHRQRFMMACTAAKEAGTSIWTIVFASGDDSTLRDCASNSDQYTLSANRDALIARFKQIGKNIGSLRLSQ